jgi:hypothetical protein
MESSGYALSTASEAKDAPEFEIIADSMMNRLHRLCDLAEQAECLRDRQIGPCPSAATQTAGAGGPAEPPCYRSRSAVMANKLDVLNNRLAEALDGIGRF